MAGSQPAPFAFMPKAASRWSFQDRRPWAGRIARRNISPGKSFPRTVDEDRALLRWGPLPGSVNKGRTSPTHK